MVTNERDEMKFSKYHPTWNKPVRFITGIAATFALAFGALPICPLSPQLAAKTAAPVTEQVEAPTYVSEDVMIPMRDGAKLHAQIWRPADQVMDLPIIMMRSPY